ncbi:MAG: tRNA (adenosine(37)-N6)-dimethylallyltransferase MiaA [Chitinophagaceae bacterium]
MEKICIILLGSTAVGKTEWAMKLARYFNIEILSVDSRQCYKEISIGVAKPSPQYLHEIPHHFINSHSIYEKVNAKIFEEYALNSFSSIFSKSNMAIMVGGTALYIDALCKGIDDIPIINQYIQNEIRLEFKNKGIVWLQATVEKEDPLFFKLGENKNPHRLLRALEVIRSHKKSIIQFHTQKAKLRNFKIIKIGLQLSKEILYQCIIERTHQMIKNGLEKEVLELKPYWHLQALQTVGYQEWIPYFEKKINFEKVQELIIIHTRQYAKRQMTWFKKDTSTHWITPEDNFESVVAWLQQKIYNLKG